MTEIAMKGLSEEYRELRRTAESQLNNSWFDFWPYPSTFEDEANQLWKQIKEPCGCSGN